MAQRMRGRGSTPRAAAAAGLLLALLAGAAGAQPRITADEAVKTALRRNPAALQAAQEAQAAGGRLGDARSQLLPQIGAGAQYANTIRTSFRFGGTGAQVGTEFWSGQAGLDQTLVSLPLWAQVRAAGWSRDAAREANAATRADIALAAYRQFYALLKGYKLADVTTMSLRLRGDQLERTKALFELGSVARGDVLKQQVALSQAELENIAAQKNIVVQRALLSATLGLDVGQTVEIDTSLADIAIAVDSAAVLREAIERRPELAEFRARVQSARAGLGAAQGSRYPGLLGNLSYSFTTSGFPDSLKQIDESARWNASVSLSIPITEWLHSSGRIREARARQLQAEYLLKQTELNVIVDVEQALQAGIQARNQIRVARAGLAAADEDLRLTQEKYNLGAATVIELIDSQVSLTRASVDLINAMADAHIAEMGMRRARGERF